jgi:hypothetical protein
MIKELKQQAIKQFERYILTINADKHGKVKCYTCEKIIPLSKARVGYAIKGANSLLFDEEIAKPQCEECFNSPIIKILFVNKLLQENDNEFIDDKIKQKFKPKRFTEDELKEIIKKYKGLAEVESLKIKKTKEMKKEQKGQEIMELIQFIKENGFGDIPQRYKEIFSYRMGLDDGIFKTLEETGKKFGITRERVRQIEEKVWETIKGRN